MKALKRDTVLSFIFGLSLFAFLSCKGAIEKPSLEKSEGKKAILHLNVEKLETEENAVIANGEAGINSARSILPSTRITDFTNFTLYMENSSLGLTNTYTFEDYDSLISNNIGVEVGDNWYFRLTTGIFIAYIYQDITEGDNYLTFQMEFNGTSNTGYCNVTLELPLDERINLIKCGLYNVSSGKAVYNPESLEIVNGEDKITALYSKTNISSGSYTIKWNIYGDSQGKILLDSKSDLLVIKNGLASNKTVNIANPLTCYDITYNLNGGSFVEDFEEPIVLSKESDFDLPNENNLVYEGHFFAGWYESSSFEGEKLSFVKKNTERALTLYAKWLDSEVKIVENYASSSSLESYNLLELEDNQTIQECWYLKPGYTYNGQWVEYNSNDSLLSDNNYNSIDAVLKLYSDNDVLLAEVDDEATFTFTVDREGFYNVIVTTAAANTFSSGYCAYYIYKQEQTYDIEYNLNGGTYITENSYQYYYDFEDIYSTSSEKYLVEGRFITKDGCLFTGWYESPECDTEPVTRLPAGSFGDKVFYAGWDSAFAKITYVSEQGTAPSPEYVSVNTSITDEALPEITCTGYSFKGWYSDSTFTESSLITSGYTVTDGITLYAKWIKLHTITYNSDYGTRPQTIEVEEGSSLSNTQLARLSASGHIFRGWYSNASFAEISRVKNGYRVDKELNLYAKWEDYVGPNDGFVYVEGGTVIGNSSYNNYYTGAFPTGRSVTLSSFFISDHEVTQSEYETYCCYTSSTPGSNYGVGDDYPVYYVSWYDALVYCNLRSMAEGLQPCYAMNGETDPKKWAGIKSNNGKYSCSSTSSNSSWNSITCDFTTGGYRLPTEAEWEYAARGGHETYNSTDFPNYFAGATTTNYGASSNSELNSVGWYSNNTNSTHEVKSLAPNALGLYDMSGNVREWCWDWYSSISSESVTDPTGPSSGSSRISRGGSIYDYAYYCSNSCRSNYSYPSNRNYFIGFRLVRTRCNFNMVSFASEHGTVPANIFVQGTLSPSQLPTLSSGDWIFKGWYTDFSFAEDSKVTGEITLTDNITLYAKWKAYVGPDDGFVYVEGRTVEGSYDYNQYSTGAFPSGRTVTLSSFFISDHEVTQGEYETYCSYTSSGPSASYGVGEDYPVYYVSWYDALVYCNLRSMAEGLPPCYALNGETDPKKWPGIKNSNGKYSCSYTSSNSTWNSITCDFTAGGYRLPTETEWEYAARGGHETYGTEAFANFFAGINTTEYSATPNDELDLVAWYSGNEGNTSNEVKQKTPNALGLYDMSGNVYELCWDWYSSSVGQGSVTDPLGASSGAYKVIRGGGWNTDTQYCSVTSRSSFIQLGYSGYNDGFRLVRTYCDLEAVSLVSDHGTSPYALYVPTTGSPSQLPTLRSRGWDFTGWYSDSSFAPESKITDGFAVTEGLVLYANWVKWSQPGEDFVLIKGETVVGSNDYNQDNTGAFPAGRTVTLSSFYISDHEVTQSEYESVMGSNPSYFTSSPASGEVQENRPVEQVSWYDAIYFCNKKSIAEGVTPCYSVDGNTDPSEWSYTPHNGNSISGTISCDFNASGYRLPTEAEWEFAARGGKENYTWASFAFYFAGVDTENYSAIHNVELNNYGWYKYNSNSMTHEVKKKDPNMIGLYDMSGNVWEWCWDLNGSISTSETVTDPCGAPWSSYRLLRGGGWDGYAFYCSVSYRSYNYPDDRFNYNGFRLVRSAD